MAFSREQRRNLVGLFYGELTLPAAKLGSATITSSSSVTGVVAATRVATSTITSPSTVEATLTGTFVASATITSDTTIDALGIVLEGSGSNVTKAAIYYRRMRA